jgi:hypothetical protein
VNKNLRTWIAVLLLATAGCVAIKLVPEKHYVLFPTGDNAAPVERAAFIVPITSMNDRSRVCFPRQPGRFVIVPLNQLQQCEGKECRPCQGDACQLPAPPLPQDNQQCEPLPPVPASGAEPPNLGQASHYLIRSLGVDLPERAEPKIVVPWNKPARVRFPRRVVLAEVAGTPMLCPRCEVCDSCAGGKGRPPPPPPPVPHPLLDSHGPLIEIRSIVRTLPSEPPAFPTPP